MMVEQLLCSPYFHVAAGLAVGAGLMIVVLAKYGGKFFKVTDNSKEGSSERSIIITLLEALTASIEDIKADLRISIKEHNDCRSELAEKYVQWEVFNRLSEKLEKDRKEKWREYFNHTHDKTSGVAVPRK